MRPALVASAAALLGCAAQSPAGTAGWGALSEGIGRPAAGSYRSGLRLHCTPADADVYLDGIPKGICTDFARTPARLPEDDGRLHLVEVKKPGFTTYQRYYAPSGTIIALNVSLQPLDTSEGKSR